MVDDVGQQGQQGQDGGDGKCLETKAGWLVLPNLRQTITGDDGLPVERLFLVLLATRIVLVVMTASKSPFSYASRNFAKPSVNKPNVAERKMRFAPFSFK